MTPIFENCARVPEDKLILTLGYERKRKKRFSCRRGGGGGSGSSSSSRLAD